MELQTIPDDVVKQFWDRLKMILKEKGKTQIELCEGTGVLLNTLRVQISRNSQPTINEIISFSEYLHVSIEYLVTGKQKEKDQVDLDKVREALQVALDMINK